MRWLEISVAVVATLLLFQERAYSAELAPCAYPVNELRCRLAITERELSAARADAIVMEGRMRLREQEAVALEAKAKWLSDVIWPRTEQLQ
jgi:hypothetical protein